MTADQETPSPDTKPAKRVTKPKAIIDIAKVEEFAAQGLSIAQIALRLGICEKTLHTHKLENAEITAAIARGRAKGEDEVSNALFKSAKNGHVEAAKFYLARRCGWREVTEHAGEGGGPVQLQIVISKDDAAL
jgi:hypothetical protein